MRYTTDEHGSRRRFLKTAAALSLAACAAPVPAQDAAEKERLPIFPLPIVAYPGELVPLHIHEPRYRQLFGECRTEGITFGIAAFVSKRIAPYGTEMELLDVTKEYDDGRLDAVVRGTRIFSVEGLHKNMEDRLYPGADVAWPHNDQTIDAEDQDETLRVYTRLCAVWSRPYQLPEETPENLSYLLGHLVALTLEQQVQLLGLLSESGRQEFLRDHMEGLLKDHRKKGTGAIA